MTRLVPLLLAIALTGLAAASMQHGRTPTQRRAPVRHPHFEILKGLVGEWALVGADGTVGDEVTVTYRMIARDSALMETSDAGSVNETVTMYYLDDQELKLTLFSPAGNQPRMKALPARNLNSVTFEFTDGTNLEPRRDMFMRTMKVEFLERGKRIRQTWEIWAGGRKANDLVREYVRMGGEEEQPASQPTRDPG